MIDKSQYMNIEIPNSLEYVVHSAIVEGRRLRRKRRFLKMIRQTASLVAILLIAIISCLNLSPTFAQAAYEVPILGDFCRVFTFREYHFKDEIKYIDVQIPQIENTGKTDLEKRVNSEICKAIDQCVQENTAVAEEYYKAFIETGGDPEDFQPIGITVDYQVKCINKEYVSFVIYQYETAFNAYNHVFYYNIELQSGKNLTLKDLYGNDYKQIIVQNIENIIAGWNDQQKSMLWQDLSIGDLIDEDTNFYMDANNQVVVVFTKYEAANGAAGDLEFVMRMINE